MDDRDLENQILEILSPIEAKGSNSVFGMLRVNKTRYQKVRDRMIEQVWIHAEKKGNVLHLRRMNFEAPKFNENDWT